MGNSLYWCNKTLKSLSEIIYGVTIYETWKDIFEYEGLYKVSNFGRIRSSYRLTQAKNGRNRIIIEKILSLSKNPKGYIQASLSKNGVVIKYLVHRLVAYHFIDNKENLPEVNHKFGIKWDNRASELEWVTKSENELHAHRIGLKSGIKGELNFMFGKHGINNPNYGRKYINPSPLRKKVLDIHSGIVYACPQEAADYLGIKRGTLVSYLTGNDKNPTSMKYIDSDVPINQKIREPYRLVMNTQTGIFYDSIKDAANAHSINYRTLHGYIKGRYVNKTSLIVV
jgi:hypothetical protein